jgi:hypothetical protein
MWAGLSHKCPFNSTASRAAVGQMNARSNIFRGGDGDGITRATRFDARLEP